MERGNSSESHATMSDSNFNISGFSNSLFNMDTATVEELLRGTGDCPTITQHPIEPLVQQDEVLSSPFKLRKARYYGETKWLKVTARSRPPSEYLDFLLAAKEAFGFENIDDFVLRDEDDAIIEPNLFSFFPDTIFRLTPKVVSLPATPSDVTSLADTVSVSGSSLTSNFSSASGNPSLAKKRKYESLNLLEELEASPGGKEVLDEYAAREGLSAQGRRKLVNLVVNLMVTKLGYHPSKHDKIQYAKEIVTAFPLLKDPGTEEGYEIFYDPCARAGYISWRLRTLNRRRKDGKPSPKSQNIDDKENAVPTNVHPQNAEQTQAQLIFLRNACPKTQKKEILVALKDTFNLRRSAPEKILEDFPRFLDAPYLIDADFQLMHPDIKITNFNADSILGVYEKYSSGNQASLTTSSPNDEPDWDKVTRAFITLLKLLPPAAKGRKKVERIGILSAIDRVILFHKAGTPLENVPVQTKQPCLVAVGPNKGAISAYFIAVEGKILPTDATESLAAFDILFKSHFVLNTEFDSNLSMYFRFIQAFYYNMNTNNVNFTARMREVRMWLTKSVAMA